jgi:hypothetical protein
MSTTVAKFEGVNVCCQTPEGAVFVKKYTHPPTTIPDDYRGTPDASAPNVVCMEVKGENQVAPIMNFPITSTNVGHINPSSMLFLHASGAKVATYNFMPISSSGNIGYTQPLNYSVSPTGLYPAVSNTTPPACLNAGYSWTNFTTDVAMMRNSYKSETMYLNATDFNNQGQITTAKFKPNIIAVNNPLALFESHANDKASLRSLYTALGMKVPLPKITDDDGYEVIKSNVNSTVTYGYAIQCLQVNPVSSSSGIISLFGSPNYLISGVLPSTSSQVLNLSSKGTTRMLREGAFVVHQNINPISEWSEVAPEGILSSSFPSAPNGVYVSLIRSSVGSTFFYAPLFSDPNVPNLPTSPTFAAFDTPWNNLDWAITLCEGITVPTTVGTTLSSVPYISVKSYSGLEIQPQFTSSLQPFQSLLPKPDPSALQMAAGIFHDRPDSLPAAANDFGTIAGAIASFLPTAVTWLKNIFGKKNDPPKQQQPKSRNSAKPVKKLIVHENQRLNQLESMVRQMSMNPGVVRSQPRGYTDVNKMKNPKKKFRVLPIKTKAPRKRQNKM